MVDGHEHQHSGLVSLHPLEDEAFALGMGRAMPLTADEATVIAQAVIEPLTPASVNVADLYTVNIAAKVGTGRRAWAWCDCKARIIHIAQASATWETLAHEIAHAVHWETVYPKVQKWDSLTLAQKRSVKRETTAHGRAYKRAFAAVIPLVAARMHGA